MPELGESVKPNEFVSNAAHDENTCPWPHEETKRPSPSPMPDENRYEDAKKGKIVGRNRKMPKNSGGRLGEHMGDEGLPDATEVELSFVPAGSAKYRKDGKDKVAWALVRVDGVKVPYPLQHAPHHLIPGNAALKGSNIVAYLGDDNVIKNFKGENGEPSSKTKEGTAGYDVNRKQNGVWLPSPYAVSMGNEDKPWASKEGLDAIVDEFGEEQEAEIADFKYAYAEAAIKASGGRQFHMVHEDYSDKVHEILDTIAVRVGKLARLCPVATKSKGSDDKCDPPTQLPARLDVLSGNLKRFLSGGSSALWRPPLFADALSERYAKKKFAESRRKGTVVKVV